MKGSVRRKLRRVLLRKKDNGVVAHGFGDNKGKFRVGVEVKRGPYVVAIAFTDDEGEYQEHYSLISGVRTMDVGTPDGWLVSLTDIGTLVRPFRPSPPKGNSVKKVWEEENELSDLEVLVWSVWEDRSTGIRYLKVTRRKSIQDEEGQGARKIREYPGLIPLSKVVVILKTLKELDHGSD